ncbi:MAG TPA: methyltransferase domain-containing protein [Streptosporangiaceae bacterium]|nr:methyltransferase domain-containing protein [Streptosporangiaceae bacterium]
MKEGSRTVTPDERWLAAVWPFVREQLPAAPGRIVEIGCGPQGGFVPMMTSAGYQASGIDPQAPQGPAYIQAEFERCELPGAADAIVACTSLHHVNDLGRVLDLVAQALAPGAPVVVVEWAIERFDEATARWCFSRLPAIDDEPGWLHERLAQWRDSGRPWGAYCKFWAETERLHNGEDIVAELTGRFAAQSLAYGPYFFPDLARTTEADEQAAIDSGEIQANRIMFVGRAAQEMSP